MGSLWLRRRSLLGVLGSALAAIHVVCCSTEQPTQRCSSNDCCLEYPHAADGSTALVRELLQPFSLEDFAENFWERMPLVIRGRPRNHYDELVGFGLDNVETVIENGVSLAGAGQEPMVLGSDWNIIKRVFVPADGEFWTAGLPPSAAAAAAATTTTTTAAAEKRSSSAPSGGSSTSNLPPDNSAAARRAGGSDGGGGRVVSLAEARRAFQRGGFSLVINRLQRRWRGVSRVSLALEDVLGHPVNANLYMTPPESQGFEAHFDWMDGIVVQLTGSKTWVLYDEMLPLPRPDLKYKPASADLGEPIAVLELHPGDMMYIPRGWPHEAAVNGTGGEPGRPSPASGGARGPSLHVTFGVETALSGTYESLLHHALEIAAVEHPQLFGLPPSQGETKTETEAAAGGGDGSSRGDKRSANDSGDEGDAGVGKQPGVPWLQLLHLWVHEVASRDKRLRRAVPLAPLFAPTAGAPAAGEPPAPTTASEVHDDGCAVAGAREDVCGSQEGGTPTAVTAKQKTPPEAVAKDFQQALEACRVRTAGTVATAPATAPVAERGEASTSTLRLLDLLLREGMLNRVRGMFSVSGGVDSDGGSGVATTTAAAELGEEEATASLGTRPTEEQEWSRPVLETLDRASFSSRSLEEKVDEFLEVVSLERALRRMVLGATRRARDRRAETERDLARCGQGR